MAPETDARLLLSERVSKIREELMSSVPQIDTERQKILLAVYRESEGEPSVMQRARLFERMCNEKTIFIDDNPIVGTLTRHRLGVYPFPEYNCAWMKKHKEFGTHLGPVPIVGEDREWVDKAVDYWIDKNPYYKARQIISQLRGMDYIPITKAGVWIEENISATMGVVPDYPKVLEKGLNGIILEVKEEMARLEDVAHFESFEKWRFYNGVLLCLNAMIKLAQRYASLAREMAQKEINPERKEELERIAETCEWVPANPPRNFREAIQSVWFISLGCWIENPIVNAPPGRPTQYLYPFYKKDKEQGRITEEEAIELIQLYFLKIQGLANFLQTPFLAKESSARLSQHLTLGGVTPEGRDATNELDYLVLEAKRRLLLAEPLVLVFYHNQLSEEFLLKCVDLIRTGIGQPAFFNTDITIQRNLFHHGGEGITMEEARDNIIWGCVQSYIPGRMDGLWEASFNMAKMVELALNNGKDPLSGVQVGPETGEAESFETYEELHEAVRKQFQYFVPFEREISRVSWNIYRERFPTPFASAFISDCIKKGKDQLNKGARYSVGSGLIAVGGIDLANSLAAIKKLVFEDKRITMKQLKEALTANFEGDGYEEIGRMCLAAPKYGNDDDYVDSIARKWYEIFWEINREIPDFLGRPLKPEAFSVAVHSGRGRLTGALPSGRPAKIALTDASVSAYPGTDKNGPTALVRSAATAIDSVKYGSNHFNMKFHPSALEGREGARKLLALIKTYMDSGGYHIQFNCVSSETLKDAQLHPDKYRDLVVRVAGFSAFFIHLDRETQDEIIKRTEIRFD